MADSTKPGANGAPRSLKQRVFEAGAWSLAGHGASLLIRFGSNLIMTRLLVPEMFGVVAIATIVMVGLAMFSDLGFRQNIMRSSRGNDPAFLNTAWALQILRGFVLWVGALIIALGIHLANRTTIVPPISVYADPSLPWVIAVLSFGAVIAGFTTTKTYEASRNLALGRLTVIEFAAQVVGVCTMLVWGYHDRSIWTLVAGTLVAAIISVIAAHVWLPGTANQWQWDRSAIQELIHFGKWMFASSILGFVALNSDRLLLGSMVDASTLGIYVIAFSIVGAADQIISRIVASVAFPALGEVARNAGDLRTAYYRFQAVIAGISYFSAGCLMTSGPALVAVLYDARYADAGWILQILAVGLLTAPFSIAIQSYLVLGKPHLLTSILTIRLATVLIGIPIGFHALGLPGAIGGIALGQIACLPMFIYLNIKNGIFDARKEASVLLFFPAGALVGVLIAVVL